MNLRGGNFYIKIGPKIRIGLSKDNYLLVYKCKIFLKNEPFLKPNFLPNGLRVLQTIRSILKKPVINLFLPSGNTINQSIPIKLFYFLHIIDIQFFNKEDQQMIENTILNSVKEFILKRVVYNYLKNSTLKFPQTAFCYSRSG